MSRPKRKTKAKSNTDRTVLIFILISAIGAALLVVPKINGFKDASFARTWETVDRAVQEMPEAQRGYTWGSFVAGSEMVFDEPYNGGVRKVQYFDKGRMEITNPNANPDQPGYVSSGLLVREMVSGKRQDGEAIFTDLTPSPIQVAGDPNDGGTNSVAPTYASFQKVATLNGTQNAKPQATGQSINSQIDKTGKVTTFTPPEPHKLATYNATTHHNIADVFNDLENQRGLLWQEKSYLPDKLFSDSPTYILGYPITEPYWIEAVVGGVKKDVLVQLFERRVLTYTPDNAKEFRVEMGNVGQHYFKWRYHLNDPAKLHMVVPVEGIRLKDDDGGRATQITPAQFKRWVDYTNQVFAPADIEFKFDPDQNGPDWTTLRNTLINNVYDPGDSNFAEIQRAATYEASKYPGKMVIFFRHGPFDFSIGGGFSWRTYNFISLPGFEAARWCGHQLLTIMAHEVGHYLGLSHTFYYDFSSKGAAEAYFKGRNNNPNIFDADNLDDTLPDPFVFTDEMTCEPKTSLTLNGVTFILPRNNIMSYYDGNNKILTTQQIKQVRDTLASRHLGPAYMKPAK